MHVDVAFGQASLEMVQSLDVVPFQLVAVCCRWPIFAGYWITVDSAVERYSAGNHYWTDFAEQAVALTVSVFRQGDVSIRAVPPLWLN